MQLLVITVRDDTKSIEIHIFSQSHLNLNEDKNTWWTETKITMTFDEELKRLFF